MSENKVIRFGPETWKKGTRGLAAPHATDKPLIKNLRMYTSGLLGPRPLWRADEQNVINTFEEGILLPTRYIDSSGPTYGILALEATGSPTATHFYEPGDVTPFAEASGASLVMGTVSNHSTVTQINATYWLINDNLVVLQPVSSPSASRIRVSDISAAIDTTFGTTFICEGSAVHQGRAFFWGYDSALTGYAQFTSTSRVYYSDSAITDGQEAYGTFASATQFFDIDGEVKGCTSVGPNLFIWNEDGDWTIMQGSGDPADATFSSIGKGKIPGEGRWPIRLDRSAIFLSSDLQSLVTLTSGGTIDDMSLAHLGFSESAVDYITAAPGNITTNSLLNSVLVPYYVNTARHLWNGVWTDEVWDVTTYGKFTVGTDIWQNEEVLMLYDASEDNWDVHRRDIAIDQPSFTDAGDFSEFVEDYDGSARGTLGLPRLSDGQHNVRVKKIIIDAQTWSSSGTYWPAAALSVSVSDGKGDSTTLSLGPADDLLSAVPNTANHNVRIVAYPDNALAFTSFADVVLENMSGIGIEHVTVLLEVSKGPVS